MIDIETPMWNPPESEYILIDQSGQLYSRFNRPGYKAAKLVQDWCEIEAGEKLKLYIRVKD